MSKLIQIDSRNKVSGTSANDFRVNLNSDLSGVKAIAIKEITYTNTFFNVPRSPYRDSDNTDFYYVANGVEYDIPVEAGQWVLTDLLDYIVTTLLDFHGDIMTYTFNQGQRLRLTFDKTVAIWTHRANGEINPLARLLGFTQPYSVTGGSTTLTADTLPDLSGVKELYICSPELAGGSMITSTRTVSLLDSVPVTVPFGFVGHHSGESSNGDVVAYSHALNANLSSISIQVKDSQGNPIAFNGSELLIILKCYL